MMVTIIDYQAAYKKAFEDLNKAWLQKYFRVEAIDEKIFSNPEAYIINKGGSIFFAVADNVVAGTFALMKVAEGIFELSKMAVDEKYQGRKIGGMMISAAIEKAIATGADKLILYSNTLLAPAIHLYKKFGFVEVPLDITEYERANIKMEYVLNHK